VDYGEIIYRTYLVKQGGYDLQNREARIRASDKQDIGKSAHAVSTGRKKRVQDDNVELKYPTPRSPSDHPRNRRRTTATTFLLHAGKILCLNMCMLFFSLGARTL